MTSLRRLAAALALGSAFLVRAAPAPAPDPAELDAAIARAAEALRLAGAADQKTAIERRLADLWVLAARQRAAEGRDDDAIAAYETALRYAPAHPHALVELGWAHLDAGRAELARARAEALLSYDPDHSQARVLLGEILYRDHRLADALECFQAAAARLPDDRTVAARVEKIQRELAAERDYRRADSSNFVVFFDGERDEQLGDTLLDALEAQLGELAREIGATAGPPIAVILYTRREFQETTGADEKTLGLYDGKIRLPVGGVETVDAALTRVLRHELVHALLHQRSRGTAPQWLHEGLAQLLEPRDPAPAEAAARRAARAGAVDIVPFSYPRALAFVTWLEGRASRTRLLWFVDLLAEQAPEDEAWRRALGGSREDLLAEWRRWLTTSE